MTKHKISKIPLKTKLSIYNAWVSGKYYDKEIKDKFGLTDYLFKQIINEMQEYKKGNKELW